jgi:ABC-2 type transport system permease protein
MFEAPGFLWLFAQEMRVLWRGSILVRTHRYVIVPVLGSLLLFQAIALVLAHQIVQHPIPAAEMLLTANINIVFLFALMFSRAVTASIDVIYGRGDADFLLASPIPPGRVLAVRMIGVGMSIAAPWMLLGGVLANALVVYGQVWALAVYPMLGAEALFTSAVAFAIVVVLLGRVAPGATRRLGHTLALFTGVGIFALGQAPRFMPAQALGYFWLSLLPGPDGGGFPFLFARGLLGQPGALAASLAFAAAVFATVWIVLARPFADGAITAAAYRPRGAASAQGGEFRSTPFAALFAKNLRLLARFPGVLSQTVYRSLTLVPVMLVLAGRFHMAGGYAVAAPLLVFLAGQLGLFFISVLGGTEDAAELAQSAPIAAKLPGRAALAAAGYVTVLLVAMPAVATLIRAPELAPALFGGIIGVLVCNLSLGLSLPIPLVRAEFGKTQQGTLLGLILGVFVSSVWSFAIWLVAAPNPLAWLMHQNSL